MIIEKLMSEGSTHDDIMHLFEKNVPGYGGPGPESWSQYFKFINELMSYIKNDLEEVNSDSAGDAPQSVIDKATSYLNTDISSFK